MNEDLSPMCSDNSAQSHPHNVTMRQCYGIQPAEYSPMSDVPHPPDKWSTSLCFILVHT